jgi:hypothetical protein
MARRRRRRSTRPVATAERTPAAATSAMATTVVCPSVPVTGDHLETRAPDALSANRPRLASDLITPGTRAGVDAAGREA